MFRRSLALFGLTLAFLTAPVVCRGQSVITTVAGNGTFGFSGDGGPGASAALFLPQGVAVDSAGNIYIADGLNHRVRKVDTGGTITTFAGTGFPLSGGDGGKATSASFRLSTTFASGVAVDSAGNLYIADSGGRIRKVDTSGNISTVAGNGSTFGFSGDGGPATSAQINTPTGVAVDSAGNIYIADTGNGRIRKVDTGGTITTVAGKGNGQFAGDGGLATNATLSNPSGVAVDSAGNIYIADNNRIRKVNAAGIINTVAGNGLFGECFGGNGKATGTGIGFAQGVAVDNGGNLYIGDPQGCIHKVDTSGTITTVAGGGQNIPGDGGPPKSAGLGAPTGVALDSAGNLYFADSSSRVRKVTAATPPAGPPAIFAGGIVNAASFEKLAGVGIVEGSIVSIFGSGFSAPGLAVATTLPLPTTLANARVLMNGIPAPLFAVTPSQINALVPWELRNSASSLVNVQVVANGVASGFEATGIGGRPGIFTTLQSGVGPGVITHANGALVTASNPAARSETVVVYCTALGQVTNQPPTGAAASLTTLSPTTITATATIGNLPATVLFSGLVPGFVGLYQVNVQVPANLQVPANNPEGSVVPLVVSISAAQSNIVTLAVK